MLRIQQSQAGARQAAAAPARPAVLGRAGAITAPLTAALDARAGSSLRCSTSRRGALTTTFSLVKRAEDVSTGALRRERSAPAILSLPLNRFLL